MDRFAALRAVDQHQRDQRVDAKARAAELLGQRRAGAIPLTPDVG